MTANDLSAVGAVAAAVVALAALAITVRQLRASDSENRLQRYFYLHEFLAREDLVHARYIVRTELAYKSDSTWTSDELTAANMVCTSYDQAAILIDGDVLSPPQVQSFLDSSWGTSICDQYAILTPYLSGTRTPTLTGDQFFRHFRSLYERASARRPADEEPRPLYPRHRTAHNVAVIVAGGQAGVDRAALRVALAHGIRYAGWVPAHGWAEDATEAPGVLAEFPLLKPTSTTDPAERSALNVRDSDATLIVAVPGLSSPGTEATKEAALKYGKPCRITDGSDYDDVARWLRTVGANVRLNVAGPRASEWAQGDDVCRSLLERIVSATEPIA